MKINLKRSSHLLLAAAWLALTACSDPAQTPTPTPGTDSGPGHDAQIASDQLVSSSDGAPTTDGAPPPADKGAPATDTGAPATDTSAPAADTGVSIGPTNCVPTFSGANACAGNLVGSWRYKAGCVSPGAFDAIKQSCPGAQISTTAYTLKGGLHSLVLKANKTFTRSVAGTVSAKVSLPAVCKPPVGGCTGLSLVVQAVYPGSQAGCAAAGSGCTCSLTLPVVTVDVGTYSAAGGLVTAVVQGKPYPYHACVKQGVLRYRGTSANTFDNKVSYVLVPAP